MPLASSPARALLQGMASLWASGLTAGPRNTERWRIIWFNITEKLWFTDQSLFRWASSNCEQSIFCMWDGKLWRAGCDPGGASWWSLFYNITKLTTGSELKSKKKKITWITSFCARILVMEEYKNDKLNAKYALMLRHESGKREPRVHRSEVLL